MRLSFPDNMTTPLLTSRGLTLLPVDCFAPISTQQGSVWLDSSLSRGDVGQISLMAGNPVGEIVLHLGRGKITYASEERSSDLDGVLHELDSIRLSPRLWAIGFISYEATLRNLGVTPLRSATLPDLHFCIYDKVLEYDHVLDRYSDPELVSSWSHPDSESGRHKAVSPEISATLHPAISRSDYLAKVARIKHHIHEGDIYQANFTTRFECHSPLDPFATYLRLRSLNPSWYGAYLNFGEYQVLSSSPERMFRWHDGRIISSPIKGTIALGRNRDETARNLDILMHSAKDRAELLMIVDLVRNDLGKIAEIGSVQVDSLCRPEIHSSLIHLVADISARTVPECTLADVVNALLPGGSVTGVPKKRAVQLLQDFETVPRSVYTGYIGYVGSGTADFNIAIRTMTHQDGRYLIHAGGGIVADSDPSAEYEEMLLKAHNLFRSLGINS